MTTDIKELTEESTKEDFDAIVEQLSEEADAEETVVEDSKEKSDAQITSEQADIEDTADSDPPVAVEKGEKKTDKAKKSDWQDEAIVEAAAYGFDEDDVAEFETREEFDRAMKLFERKVQSERDKLDEDGNAKAVDGDPAKPDDGRYEIQIDKDRFDDELVDELTRMRDHYETRLASMEERIKTEEAVAAEEKFDRTVDTLGFANLFGKTGEETEKEMARREDLYRKVKVEERVLKSLGHEVGDYDALVQRIARAAFPEEYDKKLIKNHTRKISKQSNSRQGGGVTRPTDPPEDPRDYAERLYKEMAGA